MNNNSTSNELKIFTNEEFGNVRVKEINGEPWFVGKDVAESLGYAKPENAVSAHVDGEDKTTTLIQVSGTNYKSKTVIINESGLYSLVLSSKLPNAKKFKRWITHEVIPDIRKHIDREEQSSISTKQNEPSGYVQNGMIKITYQNDQPSVSARELHEFLDVKTAYKDWFPRMCEYGFSEGADFNLLKIERVQTEGCRIVSRIVDDAVLTIDMAKEICMIQRNEKGKIARQYFLQIEKDWNSPEKVMARALQIANDKLIRLEAKIEADAPKVLFADAVSASDTSILIGDLAKLLRQNGVNIGQNRFFQWMRKNGFLTRHNAPTQKSMDMELFEVLERTVNNPDGSVRIVRTTKALPKAQIYFVNKFLNNPELINKTV